MPGHMDPNTGLWVDDDGPEPAAGGLADQQEKAADEAPPPPDYSSPPQDQPGDESPAPEPGALPPMTGEPTAEDPAQIPVGGTTTPDADIEAAIGGEGPPLDLTPQPEDSTPPPGADDLLVPPSIVPPVPEAPKPIVPASTQEELTQQQIDERQAKSVEDQSALEAKAQNAKDILKLKQDAEKQRAEIIKKGEADFASARAAQNAEYEKYRAMGERDAWGDHSTAKKILAGIAIILGGRNAAALVIGAAQGFEEKKKEQLALQKTAMEKAGHDAAEIDAKQKEDLASLATQTAAGLDSTAARLDAELAARGVPADQRAANKDVLAIKQAAFDKKRQADIDAHKWAEQKLNDDLTDSEIELNKARANLYDRMPAKKGSKGTGGGAGSGVTLDARKQLSEYALAHPGDNPGLYQLASDLKIPDKAAAKAVSDAISQNKGTESQTKDAKQSAVGLRAVDEIEKSGYKPSKDDVQKWLENQRSVGLANKLGESGALGALASSGGQRLGLLKQSETEGLSPAAQEYFANVRRFMETIGRAQSGAAISPTEWQNFFNQYGPNSKGGLAAARTYLEDQARTSGVVGRQLDVSGSVPKSDSKAKAKEQDKAPQSESARAKAILDDPRSRDLSPAKRAYLMKLASGGS